MLTRRALITSAGAMAIVGPSIVQARNIMPVRPMLWGPGVEHFVHWYDGYAAGPWIEGTENKSTNRVVGKIGWGPRSGEAIQPFDCTSDTFQYVRTQMSTFHRRKIECLDIAPSAAKATFTPLDYTSFRSP